MEILRIRGDIVPESNELQELELTWLTNNLARFIRRTKGWLDKENLDDEEKDAILENHVEEMAFYGKLLESKRVLPEDRVHLLLTLLDERKKLYTNFDNEGREERYQEGEFINRFLRRLSEVDWEALGLPDVPYDPTEIWGSFRLSEAEMNAAMVCAGIEAQFAEDYDGLVQGTQICLVTTDKGGSQTTYRIHLSRVHEAVARLDDTPGKIFEGIIKETTEEDRDPSDDEAFGYLFSNSKVFWVDSSPDSDYTDRHIRAALVMRGA